MASAVGWYDLLTLDHTVCRICYAEGKRVRIITDPAVTALRPSPRTRATYVAKQKAAFRRHITDWHPGYPVGWTK